MKKVLLLSNILILISTVFSQNCHATTWQVGPTRTYKMPSQVSALVQDGDVVEIDKADYIDCTSWNANNLTIKGVGGQPHIKDNVCSGKGAWNINGLNTTVENIEFSGATNVDQNGAGIRAQGGSFIVRNCYFHNNDNGILAGPAGVTVAGQGDVLVEYCEFYQNGFGDGYSHNMYIGNYKSFTLQYCYTHGAKIGHEIKSRAYSNYILYNRIADETSDASRSIDLPNGGTAVIMGNSIEQGPNSGNSNIIGYGLEGFSNPAPHNMSIINNTMVNNRTNGASFIAVQAGTGILKIANTIFAGVGTVISGTPTTLDSAKNIIKTNIATIGFKNAAVYDYELTETSIAVDKGANPGTLSPVFEYVHPLNKRTRVNNGTMDVGAYEYQAITAIIDKAPGMFVRNTEIWPNPVTTYFTIKISPDVKIVHARVELYDIGGRKVKEVFLTNHETLITRDDLQSGLYFINVICNNKVLIPSKIVIQE